MQIEVSNYFCKLPHQLLFLEVDYGWSLYFANPLNRELIERLKSTGLQLYRREEDLSGYTDKLAGQSIVISGVFTHHSRDEYKELIEKNGGKNVGSISAKTSVLLAGEKAGSKRAQAEKLAIDIMDEAQFLQLITQKEGS